MKLKVVYYITSKVVIKVVVYIILVGNTNYLHQQFTHPGCKIIHILQPCDQNLMSRKKIEKILIWFHFVLSLIGIHLENKHCKALGCAKLKQKRCKVIWEAIPMSMDDWLYEMLTGSSTYLCNSLLLKSSFLKYYDRYDVAPMHTFFFS